MKDGYWSEFKYNLHIISDLVHSHFSGRYRFDWPITIVGYNLQWFDTQLSTESEYSIAAQLHSDSKNSFSPIFAQCLHYDCSLNLMWHDNHNTIRLQMEIALCTQKWQMHCSCNSITGLFRESNLLYRTANIPIRERWFGWKKDVALNERTCRPSKLYLCRFKALQQGPRWRVFGRRNGLLLLN